MTMLNPHRPEWVRWIPAAILSIIILAVVLFALIAGPRIAAGPGPAEPGQVTDLNWSVFSDEGLQFIESARTPRIDLSSPPVDAVELGLPADGSLSVGPHQTGLDYRLVLIATDGEPNGALFTTPLFTVNTADGRLESVRVEERGAFTFRETFLAVSDRAPDFGYTPPTSQQLAQAVTDARESGRPSVVRTDKGLAAGMGVVAETTCFGGGFCQLSFIVTPAVG
ncbi:MAG: hypothetical protein Q7J04_04140 [Microcella sp.]|nr:hypothetical protein [Microcella sp.]